MIWRMFIRAGEGRGSRVEGTSARFLRSALGSRLSTFFSWQQDPYFFQRAEVDGEFHARFDVKTVFGRARVHDFANANPGRKYFTQPAGDNIVTGLENGVARKIGQFNQRRVARADDARVVGFSDERGDFA